MCLKKFPVGQALLATVVLMSNALFAADKEVVVVNTPDVNVANTPNVSVANTPNVNVTNTPGVHVLNTSIPVTVESAPAQPLTSHLGVPVENFAGILFNNFGGAGTVIAFGPAFSAINGGGTVPVQTGFDWVVTDIDYELSAGFAAVCNVADAGKEISLVISVNGVRNYLLAGNLDDGCDFTGRDYMTAGFVVGAGDTLSGGATCSTCLGTPIVAALQLRGYVVARPSP
jgi:hypothetical protein